MEIQYLQARVNQRWSQQENECSGSDPEHALLHLMKALGGVAATYNSDLHNDWSVDYYATYSKYLADLVICACRFAALDEFIDLDAAIAARLEEKFPL